MRYMGSVYALSILLVIAFAGAVAHPSYAVEPAEEEVILVFNDDTALVGIILDRLPTGYLFRVGDQTQVVPYEQVKRIVVQSKTMTPSPGNGASEAPGVSPGAPGIQLQPAPPPLSSRGPEPEIRGTGLIVSGWCIAVPSTLLAVYFWSVFMNDARHSREALPPALLFSVAGTVGFGMASEGQKQRRASYEEHDRWEQSAQLPPRSNFLMPVVYAQDHRPGVGLALHATF